MQTGQSSAKKSIKHLLNCRGSISIRKMEECVKISRFFAIPDVDYYEENTVEAVLIKK